MREDLYGDATDKALAQIAARDPIPRSLESKFSAGMTALAPFRGGLAAVGETLGSAGEIIRGFGQVSAATMPNTMFGDSSKKQADDRNEAFDRMMKDGISTENEISRSLRNAAQDYMPDPMTSHQAELMVADFSRVMTKAVGSTLLTGTPIPAALEEGMTTTDKLQQKGIDTDTAMQVGLVTAAANSVAFGLPIVGKTLQSTLGLAATSGPATYIAQEEATRSILKRANYEDEASLHDPYNPLGLGLATLGSFIPGGVALALRSRSASRAAAVARDETAPVAESATSVETPVSPAQVDAARVQVLRDTIDAPRLTAADDLVGAAAHRRAMETAGEQLARGEPVSVMRDIPESTLARLGESRPFMEFAAKVEEVVASGAKVEQPSGAWFSSSTVRDLEVLDPAKARDGNLYGPAVYMAKDQEVSATYARGGLDQKTGERLPDGQVYATEFIPEKVFNAERAMPAAQAMEIAKAAGVAKLPGLDGKPKVAGSTLYKELVKALGSKAAVNAALSKQGFDAIGFKQNGSQLMAALKQVPVKKSAAMVKSDGVPASPQANKTTSEAGMTGAASNKASSEAGGTAKAETNPVADSIEATSPDVVVEIDGLPRMTVAELMAKVREEAAQDIAEVPLIQAAAECFLRNGA
jgi:hypothetical protein